MESSDACLTEIPGMVFVEEDSHVMLTTCITSTIRVLSMFPYSTMSMGHMSSHLSAFLVGASHYEILTLIY